MRKAKEHFCQICGKQFKPTRSPQKFCSRTCWRKAVTGPGHPRWKNGFTAGDGYRYIRSKGRTRLEHRVVMETYFGRELTKVEVVHHVDGNKSNNSIDNLVVIKNQAIHSASHTKTFRDKERKQCAICLKIKPRSEFSPNGKRPGIFDPSDTRCKPCRAELKRKRRSKT